MNQFEQLLTCAICLDRYRNPKLLPCQHSFCMEPCMDGLVDYVRRQVKCPECRAEHRIPYQGVQAFPTNVTLKRFLDLHIEITGELPDPTSGQIMERCSVCSEKAYLAMCMHCEKKICPECKGAHMDILRREIARINNQVRRGLHKLQDTLALVEKNTLNLQTNCTAVSEEVDEIYRRLSKALKDRTEYLRGEIDKYLGTEIRNFSTLKDNLDQEISNIQSNCDLADKYMTENVEWDDCELMDAKEIFLKTVEFIRNFEIETGDYARRVRFIMSHDPNQLVLHVASYGELNINAGHPGFSTNPVTGGGSSSNLLQPPGGPGLMRSKSDHRLASQFRQQEERGYGGDGSDEPPRKFGERYARGGGDRYESSRYGRSGGNDYSGDYDYENDANRPARSRYRSRFARHGQDNDSDNETQTNRGVRFTEQQHKERERVLDAEDVTRGPLSGISRLYDSPRVMQRLQESEDRSKRKEKEPPVQPPVVQPQIKSIVPKRTQPPATQRQMSEDDEIARIKKQNKGASSSTDTTPTVETQRPAADRVAALKQSSIRDDSDDSRRSGTPASRKAPASETVSSEAESDESVSSLQQRRTSATNKPTNTSRRSSTTSDNVTIHKKAGRSTSSDSTTSSDSSASSSAVRNTGAAYTTEEVKQKYLSRTGNDSPTDMSRRGSAAAATTTTSTERKEPPKFQSRFLNNSTSRSTPAPVEKPKEEEEDDDEETETSSEEETETEEESEEEEIKKSNKEMAKTDIGPLLARSAQARESSAESSRKNSRDESGYGKPRFSSSIYKDENANKYSRPRSQDEDITSRYGNSGYTSRFLNKSKSSAAVPPDEDLDTRYTASSNTHDDDNRYPSGRSRYMAMKDRRSRLARSKSSHNFGDDDDIDEPETTTNPSAYLASRGYGSAVSSSNDLARSRSSHALKSRENSPERNLGNTEKDGAALSSWARYLKNKYGNRTTGKDGRDTSSNINSPSTTSSTARRLSLGLPLRSANEIGSSDDDSKNTLGSPTTLTAATAAAAAGIAAVTAGTSPRSQYLQKRRQLFKIGSRGSEPGCFTWPRGVAVGPDNSIVVADSSNHRVQVFDANGHFIKEFGQYGNAEGEFDCLAGVAVNRIGQYIIADRYNHRIQVFDPSGRFLRAFGSQGTSDGRFNYPWGITTDALGFIYVCDKENHRVQVFQSDGTFVGKFGSCGNKPGQLEHPHYIAVSNTNRVIVSDSNNHRVQVFDVNGRVIFSFGSEGSEEGQFKFPKGVAVDDQGYIFVADSGNNRIQIFTADGTFLRAFGGWGAGDGEFKGLEGAAVMSNGNILVCDRENHRVQAF